MLRIRMELKLGSVIALDKRRQQMTSFGQNIVTIERPELTLLLDKRRQQMISFVQNIVTIKRSEFE